MSELSVKDSLTAMEVASYLRRHPQFLGEFPDIAMALMLPREQGPAASLASYQLDVLREKIAISLAGCTTSSRSRTKTKA